LLIGLLWQVASVHPQLLLEFGHEFWREVIINKRKSKLTVKTLQTLLQKFTLILSIIKLTQLFSIRVTFYST